MSGSSVYDQGRSGIRFWVILLTDRQTNESGQTDLPPLSEVATTTIIIILILLTLIILTFAVGPACSLRKRTNRQSEGHCFVTNTNVPNPQGNAATTIATCQSACEAIVQCVGINWVASATIGAQCRLSYSWSGTKKHRRRARHHSLWLEQKLWSR